MTSSMKTCFLKLTHLVGSIQHTLSSAAVFSHFLSHPFQIQISLKHSHSFLSDRLLRNFIFEKDVHAMSWKLIQGVPLPEGSEARLSPRIRIDIISLLWWHTGNHTLVWRHSLKQAHKTTMVTKKRALKKSKSTKMCRYAVFKILHNGNSLTLISSQVLSHMLSHYQIILNPTFFLTFCCHPQQGGLGDPNANPHFLIQTQRVVFLQVLWGNYNVRACTCCQWQQCNLLHACATARPGAWKFAEECKQLWFIQLSTVSNISSSTPAEQHLLMFCTHNCTYGYYFVVIFCSVFGHTWIVLIHTFTHISDDWLCVPCFTDGFASDPFKGSDPFAADILFPRLNISPDEAAANNGDEGDTSLSCAENRASTGTQCFESEFPDEDSDIEISYSREDLDAIGVAEESYGFKPIQSSTEELGAEPVHQWRSQGQYSVESDPNGYELDLGAISPPSDIEEQSLASTAGDAKGTEQGIHSFFKYFNHISQ